MEISIKITGTGTKKELAESLRQLADDLMELAEVNITASRKNTYEMEYVNIICDLSEAEEENLSENEDETLNNALNDQLFN